MKEFEGKKGALSAIVERGIDLADNEIKLNLAHQKLLTVAKNAKNLGIGKFSRDELYGERIRQKFG